MERHSRSGIGGSISVEPTGRRCGKAADVPGGCSQGNLVNRPRRAGGPCRIPAWEKLRDEPHKCWKGRLDRSQGFLARRVVVVEGTIAQRDGVFAGDFGTTISTPHLSRGPPSMRT